MRKLVIGVVLALLLSGASSSYLPPVRILQESLSGMTLYTDFIGELKSGVVLRTDVSFDSWYDFVSFTSERICFAENSEGHQVLTCQVREPFVFWNYPEPNYFDGENYYYKHSDDWFKDTHNLFRNYLRQDFMGIPTAVLTSYPVVSDRVYLENDKYYAEILMQSEDASEQYQIEATLNPDKVFEEIRITILSPRRDGKAGYQHYYKITYDKVNQPIAVTPPKSFDPERLIE